MPKYYHSMYIIKIEYLTIIYLLLKNNQNFLSNIENTLSVDAKIRLFYF